MLNTFLRHTVATIQYRFRKSVAKSNPGFGTFSLGHGSRNPVQIVHHMYVVINFTRWFLESPPVKSPPVEVLDFDQEIERFIAELTAVDQLLANTELDLKSTKRLVQGPLSDLFTHIGQISMLQRLHGNPIKGEDFSLADINTGLS